VSLLLRLPCGWMWYVAVIVAEFTLEVVVGRAGQTEGIVEKLGSGALDLGGISWLDGSGRLVGQRVALPPCGEVGQRLESGAEVELRADSLVTVPFPSRSSTSMVGCGLRKQSLKDIAFSHNQSTFRWYILSNPYRGQ